MSEWGTDTERCGMEEDEDYPFDDEEDESDEAAEK